MVPGNGSLSLGGSELAAAAFAVPIDPPVEKRKKDVSDRSHSQRGDLLREPKQ